MRARLWAAGAILAVLALDQAVKRWLLSGGLGFDERTLIPGLVNLQFAWNRGVSFSLLWPDTVLGSMMLFVGASCIVAVLLVWAFRARRPPVAIAVGMIIGGALGNLVDRWLYGAVFDFLVMRIGDVRLFVCNLADVAITLGIAGLVIDALANRSTGVSTN